MRSAVFWGLLSGTECPWSAGSLGHTDPQSERLPKAWVCGPLRREPRPPPAGGETPPAPPAGWGSPQPSRIRSFRDSGFVCSGQDQAEGRKEPDPGQQQPRPAVSSPPPKQYRHRGPGTPLGSPPCGQNEPSRPGSRARGRGAPTGKRRSRTDSGRGLWPVLSSHRDTCHTACCILTGI